MHEKDIERVIITGEEISAKNICLAEQINTAFAGKKLLVVGILKGSILFMADLVRHIQLDIEFDFMSVSSYGSGAVSSGDVRIIKDLDIDIAGMDVLIVEDIIDSGNTLFKLREILSARNPQSISFCTLVSKPERLEADISVDFVGFEIPNEFIVGYGLDYAGRYRNLPYIGVLKRSIYE